MPITLYYDAMSQPCRAVHIFLKENKIPVQIENRLIAKGQQRDPTVKALNPNQTLPVIQDGDFAVYESHTIMRYIANAYPNQVADHWYPKDPKKRAIVDQYLDWHHTHTRRGAAGSIAPRLFAKFLGTPKEKVEYQIADSADILRKTLKMLNDQFLSEGKFLMNLPEISIADLSCSQELVMLDLVGIDYTSAYPNVAQWLQRVQQRTGDNWTSVNAFLNSVVAKRRNQATQGKKNSGVQANATSGATGKWSAAGNSLRSGPLMSAIEGELSGEEGKAAIEKLQATYKFTLKNDAGATATWLLDLKNGAVRELEGDAVGSTKSDSTFTMGDDAFLAMATGKMNPQVAFMQGKLKLAGNLNKAMAFNTHVLAKPNIKKKIQETAKSIITAKL